MKKIANHISDKGIISITYKKLSQLNNEKTTISKWAKGLNRHPSKEDFYKWPKHIKRCSTPPIIWEKQTKITMRYHFKPTMKRKTKQNKINNGK